MSTEEISRVDLILNNLACDLTELSERQIKFYLKEVFDMGYKYGEADGLNYAAKRLEETLK